MTPWRGDDACTVALAALVGRFGAVRALGATTCLLRLGALGARREQSELGERPRAPRRRTHSQHPSRPSLVAAAPAARPPARLLCFSKSRARAAKCVQANCALHARDSRQSRSAASAWALRRANCPRELSLWLLGGRRLRLRSRGASRKLLSPPYSSPPFPPARLSRSLPCTCTPPLGRSPLALLPFPGGGPTTDQYNLFSFPPFFLPLTLGSRNESSASVVIVRWNRLPHRQGLSESGFL